MDIMKAMNDKHAEPHHSANEDMEDVVNRKWEDRAAAAETLRKRLRTSWRNDDKMLFQYFQSCLTNWKVYKGPRTSKQVLKLQSYYRQALIGDCLELPPDNIKSADGVKWTAWYKLKGTPKTMAMRRFITYLSEIDPLLIDVMPDEKPPPGFPEDIRGRPICAKCNTAVGCDRPLLDQHKKDLRTEIFEDERLHEPAALRIWIKNAFENQRCIWGMHTAITKNEAKPFMKWFDLESNKGFHAYDSSSVMLLIKDVVAYHYDVAYDMQNNQDQYSVYQYNDQAVRALKLKEIYEAISSSKFVFEAPCRSISEMCNQRRLADGGRNHTHPFEIDPPTKADTDTYDECIELRKHCEALGLSQSTGPVKTVSERCDIYRARIEQHFENEKIAYEAKNRLDGRADEHKLQKKKVIELSTKLINRQCQDNCNAMRPDRVITLIKRGCDPNIESSRGVTPMICMVLSAAPIELIDEVLLKKPNINAVNKFGMTALMMACRIKDIKMVHMLMRNGAAATQSGGKRGHGRSALHWCAIHGCEEEAKILLDYVKEGGGDALRMVRLLDAQDDDGDSPLMLAARIRNGLMCKALTTMGANPNVLNKMSRNANYIARQLGWSEVADWLEKKVGSGVAKLETFSDLQFDKTLRYGGIKVKEAIFEFEKKYLDLCQIGRGHSPQFIGQPPSFLRNLIARKGQTMVQAHQQYIDNHHLYILKKNQNDDDVDVDSNEVVLGFKVIEELKQCLQVMLDFMRKGSANPNTESEAKPAAWTPLFCAVILNDIRSIKLMIREGADPNHPNKYGTTAVMVAAQCNNMEALLELIMSGGDLNEVDNEGFTPLAYSSSLPLPTCIYRDPVGVMLDDDIEGPKRLSSEELIKTTLAFGTSNLVTLLEISKFNASHENLEAHNRELHLLESYGLSRINNIQQVQDISLSTDWRLKEEAKVIKAAADDSTVFSSEADETKESDDPSWALKCPICTLPIPCQHFYKAEKLKKYLEKKGVNMNKNQTAAEKATEKLKLGVALRKHDKRAQVLEETGLDDRKTDRSIQLAKLYRGREIQVIKERLEREQMLLELELKEKNKQEAIENGTWKQFEEYYNEHNYYCLKNNDTGEVWTQHFDHHGKSFFHNDTTGQSSWENPKIAYEQHHILSLTANITIDENDDKEFNVTSEVNEKKEKPKSIKHVTHLDVNTSASTIQVQSVSTVPSTPVSQQPSGLNTPIRSILKIPSFMSQKLNKKVSFRIEGEDDTSQSDEAATLVSSISTISDAPTNMTGSTNVSSNQSNNEIITIETKSVSTEDTDEESKPNVPSRFRGKLQPNPYDKSQRKMYLFMNESAGHGDLDGLITYQKKVQKKKNETGNKNNSKALVKVKEEEAPYEIPTVQINGWLFISIGPTQNPPLETIKLPLDLWAIMIEDVRCKLLNEWLPRSSLGPVTDVKTWKASVPRCIVCALGFARMKQNHNHKLFEKNNSKDNVEIEDHLLCLPCIIRRDLYNKAKLALPRSFRKQGTDNWPLKGSQTIDIDKLNPSLLISDNSSMGSFDDGSVTSISNSIQQDAFNNMRLRSPVASKRLHNIDSFEEMINKSGQQLINFQSSFADGSTVEGTIVSSQASAPSGFLLPSIDDDEDSQISSMPGAIVKKNKFISKELAIVPFLICKGHFEEAERLIRAGMDNEIVNEGEGLGNLIKLLALQAELYKHMGLWPLALANYLDCVDLTASLLGFEDDATIAMIELVTNTFRKMHCANAAKEYITAICLKLDRYSLDKKKVQVSVKIKEEDKKQIKNVLVADAIWTHCIKKEIPRGYLARETFMLHGLGGLFNIMNAVEGHAIAVKKGFITHCIDKDPDGLGNFASYASLCFRLKANNNSDINKHLIHTIVQKFVSKTLYKTNNVAKLYHDNTPSEEIKAVNTFMNFGIPVGVDIFDVSLTISMNKLVAEFKKYFYSRGGYIVRQYCPDIASQTHNVNALQIQTAWRRYAANERVNNIKLELKRAEERRIKREKFLKSQMK